MEYKLNNKMIKNGSAVLLALSLGACGAIPERMSYQEANKVDSGRKISEISSDYSIREGKLDAAETDREMECMNDADKLEGKIFNSKKELVKELGDCVRGIEERDMWAFGLLGGAFDAAKLYGLYALGKGSSSDGGTGSGASDGGRGLGTTGYRTFKNTGE